MKYKTLSIVFMCTLLSGCACYMSGQFISSQKVDNGITKNMEDKLSIFKKSVSVICTSPIDGPNVIEKAIGTGINFIYKNWIWVLSCRHVVEPEFGKSKINSFLRIYDKNSGQLRNTILTFKDTAKLRFHPDDFDDRTRDIALFYFINISKISQEYNIFKLPSEMDLPQLKDNDSLLILGYPSKDISYNILFHDTGKELPLIILRANYLPFIQDSKLINYEKTAIEQSRAAVDDIEGLEGMSGSLVLVQHGTEYFPVGMVTGSGSRRIKTGTDTTKVNFINFVHLRYLYDLLKNTEQ